MNSKRLLLIVCLAVSSFSLQAQDFSEALQGSVKDADYILEGYATPFLKVIGYGLNQGWYNTAAPHKVAGFDITITGSPVYIPTSDLYYTIDNSKLQNLTLVSPSPTNGKGSVPSIFGPDKAPTYHNTLTNTNIAGPAGLDLQGTIGGNYVPVPMVQLGFGLPKGTDIKVRYMPQIKIGDNGSVNAFGLGVMHDIKQWIPGIKNLPFDLSGFVGFTKLNVDVGLDKAKPDQHAIFKAQTTTIQALISKKIAVLTVYGAVGYNMAKTSLAMVGHYEFQQAPPPTPPASIKDPVNVDTTANGMRATGGLRLKLAIFTFHADYTVQKYNVLTAGFGINVR